MGSGHILPGMKAFEPGERGQESNEPAARSTEIQSVSRWECEWLASVRSRAGSILYTSFQLFLLRFLVSSHLIVSQPMERQLSNVVCVRGSATVGHPLAAPDRVPILSK